MAKVLTVVTYRSVSDPAALEAYAALAGPAVDAAGGRVVARGLPLATREAGLDPRVMVIEWPDLDQALAVTRSDGYRAALDRLGSGAERDIRIVEALD